MIPFFSECKLFSVSGTENSHFLSGFSVFVYAMLMTPRIINFREDGIRMVSEILNVVIDERKQLSAIDEMALLNMNREFSQKQASTRRVFKDYILSSEVFYIDPTLN
jgi:cytochrome c biogenesis protein CcdA